MAITNHPRIGKCLEQLSSGQQPFVEREPQRSYQDNWFAETGKTLLLLTVFSLLFGIASALSAQDVPTPWRQDKPPNNPYSPREALQHMTVPDGFTVELVAHEPDIVNPIAMCFDDRGRIFVTESIEYPRKPAGVGRDRIKLLQDTNSDGTADRVTVFAEGLNIPTGVAVGYGGVWVLNAPDLLFLQEKDGLEASREVIVTGFGRTDTHELPNSLTWGPDGWLYGLNGVFNQSVVRSNNGREYKFNCALWRVHPRTREFQVIAEGTSNPYGLAWDSEGSAIVEVCHWANDHLFHFVETGQYQRQAGAFPPFTIPLGSITDHGHQKTAYCGIANLDTDVYPAQFRERLSIGNIHGGAINLDQLQRDGATYIAKSQPDLLNANDAWFMPVALKIGPDGCLYVLDWYDQYHCSQDAARDPGGVDRLKGRLYRLRYKNSPRAPVFDLASEKDGQLIARLDSGNIFFRETAQRILAERLQDASSATPAQALRSRLESLALASSDRHPRKPRLHALWALISSGSLEPSLHLQLLNHSDPAFRAWAVRAAGNFTTVSTPIRDKVSAMALDPSPDVQLQVAIAARKIKELDSLSVLSAVLAHCGHDKIIPSIAWNNLHPLLETEGSRFVALPKEYSPALAALTPRVVERILSAANPNSPAVVAFIQWVVTHDALRAKDCLSMVSARLNALDPSATHSLKSEFQPLLKKFSAAHPDLSLAAQLLASRLGLEAVDASRIRTQLTSPSEPDTTRLLALDALIAFRDPALLNDLPQLLHSSSPRFAARVFTALGRMEDPKLADVLLAEYPRLSPELQPLAIDLIMQRERWARKLLDAVLTQKIPKSVLNANHLRKILESNDREALWAVEKAFGRVREERNPEREKVVADMAAFLKSNMGDPHRGQAVFRNACAQCHAIHGEGGNVGPDLTANGRATFDQLLSNVLDPSLVIGPAYQVTTVVTKDGRNLTGLITEDNDQRLVIRMPGEGEEILPRNNIKYTRVSKLSMMPEGLESLLSQNDLADLFAFLALDKSPSTPDARLIPGAPEIQHASRSGFSTPRIRLNHQDHKLIVQSKSSQSADWIPLATFAAEPDARPYLHPVLDPTGKTVLTENQPADHPWQHGIFTGFHKVNGFNYWKEDQGKQRLVRISDIAQAADKVSWRASVELIAPDGSVVLNETDSITIHAPESDDLYAIDFHLLLRARNHDVNFGQFFVGGLAIRMPWDPQNPRQTHHNSNGLRGREAEQKRAAWCTVERPFPSGVHGFAFFDHPSNPNHPPGWRVDEQGLINPNVSALSDWSIPAHQQQQFRYRILVYRGSLSSDQLQRRFDAFAQSPP